MLPVNSVLFLCLNGLYSVIYVNCWCLVNQGVCTGSALDHACGVSRQNERVDDKNGLTNRQGDYYVPLSCSTVGRGQQYDNI